MGVKSLIKLSKNGISVADLGRKIGDLGELNGTKCAIDVSVIVHKAMRSVKYQSEWEDMHHVNAVLALAARLDEVGISHVWVFDAGVSRDIKRDEQLRRKRDVEKATLAAQIKADEEQKRNIATAIEEVRVRIESLYDDKEKRFVMLNECEIKIRQLMEKVEIPTTNYVFTREHAGDIRAEFARRKFEYFDAPAGSEAEHVCAALTRNIPGSPRYCDFVISTDMDVLPYAGILLKLPPRDNTPMLLIDYRRILQEFGITLDEFRRICVCLGTDFAPKARGIGPITAIAKFRGIKFTVEQEAAVAEFAKEIYE
jgi:5'-3' exonuclease